VVKVGGQKSGRAGRKLRSSKGAIVQVDHVRGFGGVFEALVGPIKTKLQLDFIVVDNASFQLAQKSANLVMF